VKLRLLFPSLLGRFINSRIDTTMQGTVTHFAQLVNHTLFSNIGRGAVSGYVFNYIQQCFYSLKWFWVLLNPSS
jgi:hypothetical protein